MSAVTLWARHWDREYCCIVLNVECAKGVVAVVASEIYITSDHKFDDLNYNSQSCCEGSNFFVGNELYYHKLIKHI